MADTGKAKGGGSLLGLLVPVVILTLVAGGGGFSVGKIIVARAKASVAPVADPAKGTAAPAEATVAIKELNPIVTNLASPEGSWMRLQAAIVYDKADAPQIEIVAAHISDDTLSFIKTLTMAQIQGASGLQHLREDLSERAAVRSDGHVKEMMIEMMVIQ